ncbi:MAG: bifunctional precorrin-2 dehydrogenase/sirohydrochlorin ferrochelatase [Chloroflexi bacterium]|nr:bifunctional precorrin-2 dehydrogenase/sirohydrochlorin ferrochelatase [Chloroflexota bacterium]
MYYPVFLNLKDQRCVVVGGGEVAGRKVAALLDCAAAVTVVSDRLCDGLERLAGSGAITAVRRPYRTGDLAGARLVVAATDDRAANLRAAEDARAVGALVNVVDDPADSDFIAPSCLRRGPVTVAVSTGGLSPALARRIRERLETEVGEEYAALARLVGEARARLKDEEVLLTGEDWHDALDLDRLLELLKRGATEPARALLWDSLKKSVRGGS